MIKKKLIAAFLLVFTGQVYAGLTIEITEGVSDAVPIAIVPFKWLGSEPPPSEDVAKIITNDLHRSGQFLPLKVGDMLAQPYTSQQIRFKNWRILEVPNLVIGQVSPGEDGTYIIEFRLYDVYRQKQITGFRYKAQPLQLRKIAHKISDVVYEALTGIKGAFDTKIVYIKKFPNRVVKPYRLYLADADGFGEQEVMRHNWPVFSPTWSPDNSRLAFAMAGSRGQGIFIFDVERGKQPSRLTSRTMKASAPSWSPDGKQLVMQVLDRGSSDIYTMDIATRKTQRITRHWAIDTEPRWSPDGSKIIFTSERGGSAQLYQYSFDEKKIKRVTFKGRQNLRASFSPDGKMITFVHLGRNSGYNIAVMDLGTKEMHIVADSSAGESEHESPSFAPNNSMIIYAANYAKKNNERKRTGLIAVSVDGNVRQHFIDKGVGEVRDPAWSSYLN